MNLLVLNYVDRKNAAMLGVNLLEAVSPTCENSLALEKLNSSYLGIVRGRALGLHM